MSEMVQVMIDSIRVHLMAPQRVILLKQVDTERYLTIWVGPYEAEAITVALQEVEVARPLTHDLIRNILAAFNARITRVEVVRLQNEIFYGNIVVEVNGREIHVDSRPSDAIALAVRAHVPIYVHRDIMDEAGIFPDKDIPQQAEPPAEKRSAPPPALPEDNNDRLSIFKDFLDKLDKDKPDKDKDKPA